MSSSNDPYGENYYQGIFRRQMQNSPRIRTRLNLVLETHRSGRLLEIGCGQGEFLRLAASHFDVEGVDVSRHAVQTLAGWQDGQIRNENIAESQLQPEHYHVVAAFNVLEHIRQPGPVIQKIFAALKPGGLFVGSMPLNSALVGRAHTLLTNVVDRTHVSTYPPGRWRGLFDAAGFQPVSLFGEVMFTKNLCLYVRHRAWRWLSFNLMFHCRKPA